jgi:predicted MPP superfamily phosphohydrolase
VNGRKVVMLNLRKLILSWLILFALILGGALPLSAQEKPYTHLVILSDPHLPGRNLSLKEKTIQTINAWPDADGVVVLGDICQELGTAEEYGAARKFFSHLTKPIYPIAGNHDVIYEDTKGPGGRSIKASYFLRKKKLERFKEAFSLNEVFYSKKIGPYLLIFLSVDDLSSDYLCEISGKSLGWLETELVKNRDAPTLIFFHAPLKGTLMSKNRSAEDNNFIAQPHRKIRKIVKENDQIFLWFSGHTHTAPTNIKFNHEVNLYENQVRNIHHCDMDGRSYLSDDDYETTRHDHLWTNSLYLFKEKVVIKTYDHKTGRWINELTREIKSPRK